MVKSISKIDSKFFLSSIFVFSILLHLATSIVHISQTDTTYKTPDKEILKIMMLASKNLDQKQIVQTETSNNKKSDKAKFLSKVNNHFDRETRSATTGKFKSAALGRLDARHKKTTNLKNKKHFKKKKISLSDLSFNKAKDTKQVKPTKVAKVRKGLKSGSTKGIGLGSTNDFLEDIPLGDFTKLNSQEFEFYGFYSRIRQKLEQFWGLNIQEQAEKIFKKGRTIASETNLITSLSIVLNKQGEIVDIKIKGASGVKELDDAAIESFNQAGPFPNPPRKMLNQLGRAKIEWGFVVNT